MILSWLCASVLRENRSQSRSLTAIDRKSLTTCRESQIKKIEQIFLRNNAMFNAQLIIYTVCGDWRGQRIREKAPT